ncbi:MAG: hypothetical protein K6D37_03815 [Prevotella sp.]|jgi:substrate import-associated zinc metallohydrolase lipoprotein|nr:hypothetical protein [Prevotella sp.]
MDKIFKLFCACLLCCVANATFTACSEDDLGASIYDTTDYPLDRSVYTFPLDTFVKKNFLEPYNLKFIYKMEDVGSDMQKNLVPATYEKSIDLAVLVKYLWLDVYAKLAGEKDVFLKKYSPRIIHVIGSPGYLSDGSRELGVAEGGIKVTLMEVNKLNVDQIEGAYGLNQLYFHTMHHEFGHILDQTTLRPTAFNTISSGLYDAMGWASKSDTIQAALGFVTPYGSSQAGEDWVETLSCYVTYNADRWEQLLNTAKYDWEEIDYTVEEYQKYYPRAYQEYLAGYTRQTQNYDTIGYLRQTANYEYKLIRKVVPRNANGFVAKDADGNYEISTDADNIDGREIILQKLDLVRTWLKENWDIDLDELRREVQTRQYMTDAEGNFLRDRYGEFVNRLTYVDPANPDQPTLIEQLEEEVEEYKKLQVKK